MGLQVYSKVMGTSMKQLFEQYVSLYWTVCRFTNYLPDMPRRLLRTLGLTQRQSGASPICTNLTGVYYIF